MARGKGSAINNSIAASTAKGFIKNSKDENWPNVFLARSWAQSLLHRRGFVKHSAATRNVDTPHKMKFSITDFSFFVQCEVHEGAEKEAVLLFICAKFPQYLRCAKYHCTCT